MASANKNPVIGGRHSAYKNVYAQEWPTNQNLTGLNVNLASVDAACPVISASQRFFATPWKIGGGGAAIVLRFVFFNIFQSMLNYIIVTDIRFQKSFVLLLKKRNFHLSARYHATPT